MWIHFDLVCGVETQKRFHKKLRSKILNLENRKIVDNAVLTYHWHLPRAPTDSLYFCLNVLGMREPEMRSKQLCEDSVKEIPEEIKRIVKSAVRVFENPFLDRVEVLDYEVELMCSNASFDYGGASIGEIIEVASSGTRIALQILNDNRTKKKKWKSDNEIATNIKTLIEHHLRTPKDRWLKLTPFEQWFRLHFIINPLGMVGVEDYTRGILNVPSDQTSQFLLQRLYESNEIKWKSGE